MKLILTGHSLLCESRWCCGGAKTHWLERRAAHHRSQHHMRNSGLCIGKFQGRMADEVDFHLFHLLFFNSSSSSAITPSENSYNTETLMFLKSTAQIALQGDFTSYIRAIYLSQEMLYREWLSYLI